MPIYEYKCQQCGSQFEKRQGVADEPLTVCEKCHGKLEKQWSLSGFQFKGEGWYVTDYAGKKADGKGTGDKSASTESTSPADGASKEKTETPSPSKDSTSSSGKE